MTTGLACGGQAGCADRWLGFITASVAACVKTGDAAYRSVSVPPTFPIFTSASLSDSVSENALASTWRSLLPCFFGLYLCKAVIQCVCHCLKLVCLQLSSPPPLIASQQACRLVPWPPTLVHRVDKCLRLHITHCLLKSSQPYFPLACWPPRQTVPKLPLRSVCPGLYSLLAFLPASDHWLGLYNRLVTHLF